MATTPADTPLPDIEGAIRQEVDDINKRRPVVRFSTEPSGVGLPHLKPADPPPPEPIEAVPLPEILAAIGHAIEELDERLTQRLARIERVLGIQ